MLRLWLRHGEQVQNDAFFILYHEYIFPPNLREIAFLHPTFFLQTSCNVFLSGKGMPVPYTS
jgi:hypothetical protein